MEALHTPPQQGWLAGWLAGRPCLDMMLTLKELQTMALNIKVYTLGWLACLAGWEGLSGYNAVGPIMALHILRFNRPGSLESGRACLVIMLMVTRLQLGHLLNRAPKDTLVSSYSQHIYRQTCVVSHCVVCFYIALMRFEPKQKRRGP